MSFPGQPADDAPVVLLDEDHQPIGQLPKSQVHHERTPLHLAFSCYIFDDSGRVLMTRRAVTKKTWPGGWTNTCCGHPLPDEPFPQAAARRLADELGLRLTRAEVVLPDFRYRAVAPDGVVENEFCPVLTGTAEGDPRPNPTEVMDHHWAPSHPGQHHCEAGALGRGERSIRAWRGIAIISAAPWPAQPPSGSARREWRATGHWVGRPAAG